MKNANVNLASNSKISVIMSTYKENKKWVIKSIESILNQTYSNFEYLIILDYPENEELDNLIRDYANKDSRIRYFKNEKNIGLTASLNFALTKVSDDCDYIARMDADDISLPDRFEKQLKYMQTYDVDIVGSNVIEFADDEELNYSNVPIKDIDIRRKILYYNQLAHPTWIVKREVFDTLKGYRNMYACEDYDFLLRAIKAGYTLGNVEDYLLKYRINPNSISRKNFLRQKLSSEYVAKNFYRIDNLNPNELNDYLDNLDLSDKVLNKYTKALSGLQRYRETKNPIFLIGACLSSRYFWKFHILSKISFRFLPISKENIILKMKFNIKTWLFPFLKKKSIVSLKTDKKKVILLDVPQFCNLGDHAIAQAEEVFFQKHFPDYEIYSIAIDEFEVNYSNLKKNIKSDDVLVLVGGGNLGVEYFILELHRRKIIEQFKENRIILFPQTLYFGMTKYGLNEFQKTIEIYSKNKNLILLAREKYTYHIMKANFSNPSYLVPDVVLSLNECTKKAKKDILFCMRSDIESSFKNKDREKILRELKKIDSVKKYDTVIDYCVVKSCRNKELKKCYDLFNSAKFVVTDRLHGMIFSAITKTPCIVFGNYNYKVRGVYETWLKKCDYIFFCNNYDDFMNSLVEVQKLKKYDIINFENEFLELAKILKEYNL